MSTVKVSVLVWLHNLPAAPLSTLCLLQMVHRLFSVDVVMVLLEQPERQPEECQDNELAAFLPHKFLIQSLLFARRMDSSPTVQGHALACLAQCLELPSLNATRAVHHLFSASEEMKHSLKPFEFLMDGNVYGFFCTSVISNHLLCLISWIPDGVGGWNHRRYTLVFCLTTGQSHYPSCIPARSAIALY